MSGLEALGIAANIFAVVDFSTKFISLVGQIIRDGSSVEHNELEMIADDLETANRSLGISTRPIGGRQDSLSTKDENSLRSLIDQSNAIANELLNTLAPLKLRQGARWWEACYKAIKTVWKKDKIETVTKRLVEIRAQLHYHVTLVVNAKQDNILLILDERTRTIIDLILDEKKFLQDAMKAQTAALSERHDLSDALRSREHQETMKAISLLPARLNTDPGTEQHIRKTLLDQLKFPALQNRFDDIAEAHKKTFNWIFEDRKDQDRPFDNFVEWAQHGTGAYWITGKAGSGKSTLVKFISEDPRTRAALEQWAGTTPLLLTSFYFWSAGSILQRSQEGLLRGILYGVLSEEPDLIETLFPDQFGTLPISPDFPLYHDLKRAFRRLVSQNAISLKLVIFIDGLDEYDAAAGAGSSDIIDVLPPAFSPPNVKFVVSSRPYPEFEEAFAVCPKLRLHLLTEEDIASYVDSTVHAHPRMRDLACRQREECQRLLEELVETASGVFLWVNLVVKSLLRGLQYSDGVQDLRTRLRELPSDLEALIGHMYDTIEPRYRERVSRIIQMVRTYTEVSVAPFPAMFLSLAEKVDNENISLTAAAITQKHSEVDGLLAGCCRGLLEISHRNADEPLWRTNQTIPTATELLDWALEVEVQFVHKSVVDFLEKPRVWEGIVASTSDSKFHPLVALMQSMVLLTSALPPMHQDIFERISTKMDSSSSSSKILASIAHSMGFDMAWRFMSLAKELEESESRTEERLLDEMDSAMTVRIEEWLQSLTEEGLRSLETVFNSTANYRTSTTNLTWYDIAIPLAPAEDNSGDTTMDPESAAPPQHSFLALCVFFGLNLYVQAKAETFGDAVFSKPGMPLSMYPIGTGWCYSLHLKKLLISKERNVNQMFHGRSSWQYWVGTVYGECGWDIQDEVRMPFLRGREGLDVFEAFLIHGAEPNATISAESFKDNRENCDHGEMLAEMRQRLGEAEDYSQLSQINQSSEDSPEFEDGSESEDGTEAKTGSISYSALTCFQIFTGLLLQTDSLYEKITDVVPEFAEYQPKESIPLHPEPSPEELVRFKEIEAMFIARGGETRIYRDGEIVYPPPKDAIIPVLAVEGEENSAGVSSETRSVSPATSSHSATRKRDRFLNVFRRKGKQSERLSPVSD